tara:strand:+ start:651 stop:821 length:171 start_codon:yes stop_codon:yes gene_type:complete
MNNNLRTKENKMLSIDDSVQSIIDPVAWQRLPATQKLRVFKLLDKIWHIVHTPTFF